MTVTENELKNGRIVGIAGPVVDVEFPAGALRVQIGTTFSLFGDVMGHIV